MSFSALLRTALRAYWLRPALVALLLVAQHGALTHALTHVAAYTHAETARAGSAYIDLPGKGGTAGTAAESCVFDLAYSQVLGGVHTGHAVAFAAAEHVLVIAAALAVHGLAAVVPYDSRGPPVIS